MIHLEALPGTPASRRSVREIESQALQDARIYREEGVHGIMLENMHDAPYLRGEVGPEIVAVMAIVASAVKEAAKLPCGVQVLAGANMEAMAVAHAARLDSSASKDSPSPTLRTKPHPVVGGSPAPLPQTDRR